MYNKFNLDKFDASEAELKANHIWDGIFIEEMYANPVVMIGSNLYVAFKDKTYEFTYDEKHTDFEDIINDANQILKDLGIIGTLKFDINSINEEIFLSE